MAALDARRHLPLPTLTVSRMDQLGDWKLPAAATNKRWQNGRRPQGSPRRGGGEVKAMSDAKRKVGAKSLSMSIEETLSLRRGLIQVSQSKSSPLLLLGRDVTAFAAASAALAVPQKPQMSAIPHTTTPTPLCVSLASPARTENYHGLLTGAQKIDLPSQVEDTNECVAWYRQRELANRCSLPSAEAEAWLAQAASMSSPSSSRWTLQESQSQILHNSTRSPNQSMTLASTAWHQLPPETVPRLKDSGWKQVRQISVWAEQARKIASWRVSLATRPSAAHERCMQERLKLLDLLEQQGVRQGLAALRAALRLRFGSLERAFTFFDVAGRGQGPSLQEMSGSLALVGLDVHSLCGQGECEVFSALDVDRDGRIGLEDLRGRSSAPARTGVRNLKDGKSSQRYSIKDLAGELASWENDMDAASDPEGPERWALLAKFIALSSWFNIPAHLRHRGRPDIQKTSNVSMSLVLQNIDYPRLSANKPLFSAVVSTLKECIAREAGSAVFPRQVQLQLSAGSLCVQARIEVDDRLLAEALRAKLDVSSTFAENVASSVQNIVGIDSVTTGLLAVKGFKLSKVGVDPSAPQKLQSASPAVGHPGIGLGPPTGDSDLHVLIFTKVNGSVVPEGWRLATHTEVRTQTSDVLLLMDDWDICGLAGGWRFDGAGYGHNLKEPSGPANFSTIIVCRRERHSVPLAPTSAPVSPQSFTSIQKTAAQSETSLVLQPRVGALERQHALDELRRCWSPNDGDLESARQVLQLQFMEHSSARQFGEPLLSRSDMTRMLGKLPPPGLTGTLPETSGNLSVPTLLEVGELFDSVLELQVVLTSRDGRALSKGLTFESLHCFLQKLALTLGLHFRHIVDDSVEAYEELSEK